MDLNKISALIFLALLFSSPIIMLLLFGFSVSPQSALQGKTVDTRHLFDSSDNQIEIVFFGYVGCESVCPSSLAKLRDVQNNLPQNLQTGIHFIDVQRNNSLYSAQQYADVFHNGIKAHTLPDRSFHQLARQFGVSVNASFTDAREIYHTDHFFVLSQQGDTWIITSVLPNNSSSEKIKEAILAARS